MNGKDFFYATLVACSLLLTACDRSGNETETETAMLKTGVSTVPGTEKASPEASSRSLEQGQQAFTRCIACHTADPKGGHKLGPNLYGIVAQPAAARQGFEYSLALSNSGLSWDRATLHNWISNPAKLVPGTNMIYVNTLKQAEIDALIDYLASVDHQ